MKLSEKGKKKLIDFCNRYRFNVSLCLSSPQEMADHLTLKQSDFEGVVVLTLKEAELLMDAMREAQQLEVRPDTDGETVAKLDGLVNLIAEKMEGKQ